tara:strand:+ start:1537 stop:3006 length:1470 start_codon:yes stop_codon:yes gene_type:complete
MAKKETEREGIKDSMDCFYSIKEAAQILNVSTKTISRWRKQGLPSLKLVGEDGRKRIVIKVNDIKLFRISYAAKTEKGSKFSHLTPDEKEELIQEVKSLISLGVCPSEVTKSAAKSFNRSVETVRYIIKEHDMLNINNKLFHKISDPLSLDEREAVFNLWLSGQTEEEISNAYCRSRSLVKDTLAERRINRLADIISPLRDKTVSITEGSFCVMREDFVWYEDFENLKESDILRDIEVEAVKNTTKVEDFYLNNLYMTALLNEKDTFHLFRKYNFLKWKIHTSIQDICADGYERSTNSDISKLERLAEESMETKRLLVSSNLRLVVSLAKKQKDYGEFFSLVSDGNMSLIRAIDKYDFTIGTKFSTYATAAISKNFSRTIPKEIKLRERFKPTSEEMFNSTPDERGDILEINAHQEDITNKVRKLTGTLDSRESRIISLRFGLDYTKEPMTLKEIGLEVGLTKERVRQIAETAISKMNRVGTSLGLNEN